MTDDERPLKAGGDRATPPTLADRQAIHQRDAEAAGGLLDGFYVIEDADVDFVKLAAGYFSWSAALSAVSGQAVRRLRV
jgi:hypothetical protein